MEDASYLNEFLPDLKSAPAETFEPPAAKSGPGARTSALPAAIMIERRAYQRAALQKAGSAGLMALVWRRQAGKTSTLAEIALKKMMQCPGRLVTFASACLLLGREIIYKESQVIMRAIAALERQAQQVQVKIETLDRKSEQALDCLSEDSESDTRRVADLAELYEAQRLEFRLYHSASVYSRTQVIAPNPATARGWTGDVMLDEIGFIADLRSLWEAMEPIVSSDPDFRVLMATTPPADDGHFCFELLAPAGPMEFSVNPEGNWYRSEAGLLVHRCDIYDAAAAGAQVYDLETRLPLTPEQHFARALDKDAWRRNYGLQFLPGGTCAVSMSGLAHAQQIGQGQCLCWSLDGEEDLQRALDFLQEHLGDGVVGLGLDLATTEKETSNPTALAVMEKKGERFFARLVLVWKTADPAQSRQNIQAVLDCVGSRAAGGQAQRFCIDATNERYFATSLREQFEAVTYVELVVGSERASVPGQREPITMKAYLGHEFINALEAGRVALPPERYLKDDFRLVKKARGSFEHDLAPAGQHGDTFDACKLAYRATLLEAPGPCAFVV